METTTYKIIPPTEEVILIGSGHLSENEIQVLMYIKGMKPHSDPTNGMEGEVFGGVCEMLKERKYIRELKRPFAVS